MLRTSTRLGAQVGIKLARLLELPEKDFEKRVRELESKSFFRNLLDTRVITIEPYANAGFAVRRFGGWGLSTASEGLSEVLDGQGEMAELLQRVGQERFEECFLRGEGKADLDRAQQCGISLAEAVQLRELVNRLYVQAEFDGAAATAAPAKTYSAVAGITLDGKKPVLAFFNREIWKGRYKVDEKMSEHLLATMPKKAAELLKKFLHDLELMDRRKTTLYRVLEALIQDQAKFFVSGDPSQRRPLTQREVSSKLDVDPSVLNRLISNKSIELPWGLEAPIKMLMPSRKSMLRDILHDLILVEPDATAAVLSKRLHRLCGTKLSESSIVQYRAELRLGDSRRRRSKT